jgi:hypothetical protein
MEEVILLPIKVYVPHQQEAVFAILLCVTSLRMFCFVAIFNEPEGKHSLGRCLHVSTCEKFSNFFLLSNGNVQQ